MTKILTLCIAVAIGAGLLIVGKTPALAAKPSTGLEQQAATVRDWPLDILIETVSKPYTSVVSDVERLGGTVSFQYQYINALAATVPASAIAELTENGNIVFLYKDTIIELPPAPSTAENEDYDAAVLTPMVLPEGSFEAFELTSVPRTKERRRGQHKEDLASLPPNNYFNPTAAGVTPAVLSASGSGDDTILAIIDTGINSGHFLLDDPGKVVGGVDVSFDVGTPFEGFDKITNNFHGSFVASVAAGSGAALFPASSLLVLSIELHSGQTLFEPFPGFKVVPLSGIAPAAQLFIAKVFDHTGGGVPTSIILAGMDAVIDAKVVGGVDIDIANLSLGGPTLFDGRDLFDQEIDAMTANGITPVIAAGNDGPASHTVSSPGTANTAVTVAAASHPVNTRVFWDFNFGALGIGSLLRVDPDIQVIFFSSTGPTSDGRDKADLTATGLFNLAAFAEGTNFGLAFASGTSFSTPGVAGGIALLNSFAEKNGIGASANDYKQAVTGGATPIPAFPAEDQGAGYLNVEAALASLLADPVIGDTEDLLPLVGQLEDISNIKLTGQGHFSQSGISIIPGEKTEFAFEIGEVDSITVSLSNVDVGAFNPFGINSFELYLQSAKRTTADYIVDSANVFGNGSVTITDDAVNVTGAIFPFSTNPHVLEPGVFRVVLENDHTSADVVSGDISIEVTRSTGKAAAVAEGEVDEGTFTVVSVPVPPATTQAILELEWVNEWNDYPTADLDMFVISDAGINFSGATLNAPERVTLSNPTFIDVFVFGFEVNHGRGVGMGRDQEPFVIRAEFD